MRPIFKCKLDQIEAHYYKSISDTLWMVQCFACGARAIYNTETHELTPYNKNKGRKNEFNLYLDKLITDDGKEIPAGGQNDSKSLPLDK